jgi:hypothetical protein
LAAAPIFLPFAICAILWSLFSSRPVAPSPRRPILLVLCAFSFASILRVILNVTTTGPYTPFFAPLPIIVTLYLLFHTMPAALAEDGQLRLTIRRVAVFLIAVLVIGMAVNSAQRFRRNNNFRVGTSRGSFLTSREIGEPLAAAIQYVEQHTNPDDYLLALPVATTINFLTARRYPLSEEIVHPGFLDGEKENEATRRLAGSFVWG